MRLSMVKISFKVKVSIRMKTQKYKLSPLPSPLPKKKEKHKKREKLNTAKRICQGHATFHVKLAPCKLMQHCWPTTLNIFGSCCICLHIAESLTSFKLCATTPDNMQHSVQM